MATGARLRPPTCRTRRRTIHRNRAATAPVATPHLLRRRRTTMEVAASRTRRRTLIAASRRTEKGGSESIGMEDMPIRHPRLRPVELAAMGAISRRTLLRRLRRMDTTIAAEHDGSGQS